MHCCQRLIYFAVFYTFYGNSVKSASLKYNFQTSNDDFERFFQSNNDKHRTKIYEAWPVSKYADNNFNKKDVSYPSSFSSTIKDIEKQKNKIAIGLADLERFNGNGGLGITSGLGNSVGGLYGLGVKLGGLGGIGGLGETDGIYGIGHGGIGLGGIGGLSGIASLGGIGGIGGYGGLGGLGSLGGFGGLGGLGGLRGVGGFDGLRGYGRIGDIGGLEALRGIGDLGIFRGTGIGLGGYGSIGQHGYGNLRLQGYGTTGLGGYGNLGLTDYGNLRLGGLAIGANEGHRLGSLRDIGGLSLVKSLTDFGGSRLYGGLGNLGVGGYGQSRYGVLSSLKHPALGIGISNLHYGW